MARPWPTKRYRRCSSGRVRISTGLRSTNGDKKCQGNSYSQANVHRTNDDKADERLAQFFNRMTPNTLTYFENLSDCGIGPEACKALSNHAKSLTKLKLAVTETGLPGLAHLEPCTSLETLTLTDMRPPHDLKKYHNDVFLQMIAWLEQCSKLRDLALINFVSAPALLAPILDKSGIRLEALRIHATDSSMYPLKDNQDFHRAMSRQSSLRSLVLKADADGTHYVDAWDFCDSLSLLKDLTELKLTRISEMFTDVHVKLLCEQLVKLEDLSFDGHDITDKSLKMLPNLGNLKSVTFSGLTSFTVNGLLDFINTLGSGNQGLSITIDRADVDSAMTEKEQSLVREALAAKVQGRFEYQLLRGKQTPHCWYPLKRR